VITFANRSDFISFRHHTFRRVGGARQEVELAEAGPRFELRPFQVRLGTLDQPDADVEWVLRPYMNTAKRQRRL
jgi:U3 small nucleolar ribonucleoprotein protein IMP4